MYVERLQVAALLPKCIDSKIIIIIIIQNARAFKLSLFGYQIASIYKTDKIM